MSEPISQTQSTATAEAVVAGHICLDVIPTLRSSAALFAPGRLVEAGPAILATGGAVSNTGLALHRLGIATRLMGKVGGDLFGQAVLDILTSHGTDLASGMIVAPSEATSYSIILSPSDADRMFIHAPGCNATYSADDVYYDIVAAARLFHFGYPPLMERLCRDDGAELAAIFRRATATGVTTALDLSMPDPNGSTGHCDWRAILSATLPHVAVFLPNIEELLVMLRPALYEQLTTSTDAALLVDVIPSDIFSELARELLDLGVKIVGLKAGHRGFYLRTADTAALTHMGRAQPANLAAWANRELWAPCYAANVIGTTGSGDATIAGFLMGLLHGMDPEDALAASCAVGACSVEAADAQSGVRDWPATAARIAADWPRLPLTLAAPGWRWDRARSVWHGPADSTTML